MAETTKNPYQMNLLIANRTKLYNQGAFWAYNTAKYRALLSNDPTVIKYFYRNEASQFIPDIYHSIEQKRSFYYGDEFVENAEEFFGIIPMLCESTAKMVCGSGYGLNEVKEPEWAERLKTITDENEFETETLKASIIETLGLGSPAWHVHFDPEISDYPLIELVPTEKVEYRKRCGRIIEYKIKQQVVLGGIAQPYELHTVYTKVRKEVTTDNGAKRWRDDGIKQEYKIWNGSRYLDRDVSLKKKIFDEYGVQESVVLPLLDFPVIPLFNTLNNTCGANTNEFSRPYGAVFGLETVSSAIDEILSNCVDTIRKAFPFLLIDQGMIPSTLDGEKDKGTFSTRRHSFVLPKNMTDPEKALQFIQAKLNTTEYIEALKFQINIALNKFGINAATLGLQLSGHIESEATQNARERNSIRTRNTIAGDYTRYMSKLFAVLLQYEDYINGLDIARDSDSSEEGFIVEDYRGITPIFNKYIVDTPEEVSEVLARKVQSNLMSIFSAVREQHPEWTDEMIFTETNLILAERAGVAVSVEPKNGEGNDDTENDDPPPDDSDNAQEPDKEVDGGETD